MKYIKLVNTSGKEVYIFIDKIIYIENTINKGIASIGLVGQEPLLIDIGPYDDPASRIISDIEKIINE